MTATAYGVRFRLPFPCPELTGEQAAASPDVSVVEGPVPRRLDGAPIRGPGFDAGPDRFLWRAGRRAGRFLIEGGERITFERSPAGEDAIIAFHFLHTVMAALLHQRGFLVLHASAVQVDGGVLVLSGESGAGKSTILAALAARGYPMLSDDVTALRMRPDGNVEVVPGPAWIHLCDDAAIRLSPQAHGLPRHSWHRMKVAVPIAREISPDPLPFRRWATLALHSGDTLRIGHLSGGDKLAALQDCIFVPMFPREHAERFTVLHAVVDRVRVLAVARPAGQWLVDEVVEAVLNG